MTRITVRRTYRQTLAQVAEQARALLPTSTNGRIESAVKLVLSGDVFCNDDGSVEVGGSDPTRYYRLVGTTCTCTDFVQEKAPQGMCKHRIAANLQRSVERVLARRAEPEPEPVDPEMLEAYPDNDPGPLPELAPAPQPASAPLPKAAFSITLKGTLDGQEALLTARGQTAAEFQRNLQAIRGLLDAPAPAASPQQHNAAAMHRPITGWCAVHQVAMTLNEKDGRSWYSHRTEDGHWCKGRG